ncbi:PREDICTED: F-box/LRR-repeat protein At3g58900-like [Prunus mume]|uniref:F-box/LRR-repeat protein At3g58900-like n=1 Tax=Prunus mume TaxID=102107 RepID=A0ABM0PNN3_PRUMU|nr:PREDICTED: F-box/LRR-repeat protein At3g58900-like [Prunus mume]
MGRKRKLLGASASCEAQGNCSESATSDRFSDLPDEVAHHILSLLTFKDLTRVGAVSKRCGQLHLSVPVVDFRSHWHWLGQLENYLHNLRLMRSMERYLLCRGDNRMQRFCMDWNFYLTRRPTQDYFRVITWIHNALRCNVEELDLCISGVPSFSLPPFLPQSLRSLSVRLSMEIFKTPSPSISSNLRYLKLVLVKIEDERFFKWITCCCKCIKQLELVHIQGIRNITIESSSLEYFYGFIQSDILHVNISGEKLEGIDMCLWFHGYPEISCNSLKIFAPNLKNLNWKSSNGRYSPNLGKLMSLEKVQLFLDSQVNELDKVLCSICSAKDLIINERTIKAIFKDGSTAVPILDNICNLTVHFTSLNDDLVPAVASLLKRMPNLNFLSMKTTSSRSWDAQTSAGFGIEYWKLQNLAFLHQLKEVTIEYPDNVSNELEFARYILEHAQNLKKMVNLLNFEDTQFEVLARMVSRSKMISTATVLIRKDSKRWWGLVTPIMDPYFIL